MRPSHRAAGTEEGAERGEGEVGGHPLSSASNPGDSGNTLPPPTLPELQRMPEEAPWTWRRESQLVTLAQPLTCW